MSTLITGLIKQNGFHAYYSAAHKIAPDPAHPYILLSLRLRENVTMSWFSGFFPWVSGCRSINASSWRSRGRQRDFRDSSSRRGRTWFPSNSSSSRNHDLPRRSSSITTRTQSTPATNLPGPKRYRPPEFRHGGRTVLHCNTEKISCIAKHVFSFMLSFLIRDLTIPRKTWNPVH